MNQNRTLAVLLALMTAVFVFVGSGKTGKSGTAHGLMEALYPHRVKCHYDPDRLFTKSPFPGYILAHTFNEIPNGCVCFIEDAAGIFPSRGSNSDPKVQKWLGRASHKDIILVLTVQSTADVDKALFRSQNTIQVLKEMYDEDIEYERDIQKPIQECANRYLRSMAKKYPDEDIRTWSYFPRFHIVMKVILPLWWNRSHSHMLEDVALA